MKAFFISTLPPGPGQRRAAGIVLAASLLMFAVAAPFASVPLGEIPAFLPAYQSALVINDAITAVLLIGQYRTLGSPSLLVLACGYVFSAFMALLHALSFPGLFAPGGLLGAGPQTAVWLYFFWHGGFPLFVIVYAWLRENESSQASSIGDWRPWWVIVAGTGVAVALASALAVLATWGQDFLPPIMSGPVEAPGKAIPAVTTWSISLVALALAWRRRTYSVLAMWMTVVLVVWVLELALVAVLDHSRYDLGWYAGRAYGLLASGCVLVLLLLESNALYGRLAASIAADRRKAGDLESLSGKLRQANDELAQKNRLLAQASQLKSEFLANMSHELRTPLNAVIGFSDVLKEGIAGELSAQQKDYVAEIHSSGGHLLSLINDILDLSKIEAGGASLDLEVASVQGLFGNALSIVKEQAARRRIDLVLELQEESGPLAVDARKIKQITYNLLSNAVKFTEPGGRVGLRVRRVGRLAVEGWNDPAETVVRRPLPRGDAQDFLEIQVEDTGIGIAPQDASRLFQVFSQIDSSLAREVQGTGLGLVLVERLATLHGGTVALASTPGRGSRVCVWVPWRTTTEASDSAPPRRHALEVHAGRDAVALVIEDNDQAADLMRLHLEPLGFQVRRASDARHALELLGEVRPRLIVLDLLLRDMDGWQLLAQLRQADSPAARVPVVIVSIASDAGRGLSLGASAVLQKPIQREDLLRALEDAGVATAAPSMRVLLVDDDPQALELMASYLAAPRYRVMRAFGGHEGVELARRERPDLIVLDLMMPEFNGFEVVAALNESPDTSGIPLVVVTAKSLTAQERGALHRSVSAVLAKNSSEHVDFVREVIRAVAAGKARQLVENSIDAG